MRRIWRIIRFFSSIITRTAYLWWTVRSLPPEEQPAYRARHQTLGSRAFCEILGVRVTVSGTLPQGGAMLVVSNHISAIDPFMLASHVPVVFVGKSELRDWPVAGWVCRTVGLIFVKRERRMQAGQSVEEMQERLRAGVRVLVFPEGTTSDGTAMKPFKTGGFQSVVGMADGYVLPLYLHLKQLNGRPVTPEARQRFTWSADIPRTEAQHFWSLLGVKSAHVEIRVGAPILIGDQDRKALARQAQATLEALAAQSDAPSPVAST